jgi:hypothetical protein
MLIEDIPYTEDVMDVVNLKELCELRKKVLSINLRMLRRTKMPVGCVKEGINLTLQSKRGSCSRDGSYYSPPSIL